MELVVVDGEAIMKRVFGELVDLQAFDEAAYECIGSSSKGLHARIAELFGYLKRMTGKPNPKVRGYRQRWWMPSSHRSRRRAR